MAVTTDFSSGALPAGLDTSPTGSTYRGMFSSWFNQRNIDREDWLRSEQSANNQFLRQSALDEASRRFNAEQAQIEREWSEKMRKTAYQDTIADMKAAGINPILAFQQGASSAPSGASAAASSGSASGGYSRRDRRDPGADILKLVAGLISTVASGNPAASTVVSETIDLLSNPNDSRSAKIGTRTTTTKTYKRR